MGTKDVSVVLAYVVLLVGAPLGCTDEQNDDFNPGGSTGPELDITCLECNSGDATWICLYSGIGAQQADENVCASSREDALENECPAPGPFQSLDDAIDALCEEETDAEAWEPGRFVQLNSSNGHYEIDEDFFNSLVDHPGQLLHDSTYVEPKNPYYMLHGVASGSFADEIGLGDGDKLIAVNGNTLSWDGDIAAAFYSEQSETSFVLQVYHWPEGLRTIYIDLVSP